MAPAAFLLPLLQAFCIRLCWCLLRLRSHLFVPLNLTTCPHRRHVPTPHLGQFFTSTFGELAERRKGRKLAA